MQASLGLGNLRQDGGVESVAGAFPAQPVAVAEAGHLQREQAGVEECAMAPQDAFRAVD
jgi:hypothetical protein